ncbi:isatin hydrolase-like [Adelges cooleyi]|uniref:isatin hydrolase-like n=1 Tax=Adelges cooleyi TaxID=133065 RepID=UPI0021803E9B|nr:isatin hydrolase-like [Adelges cooleyi]
MRGSYELYVLIVTLTLVANHAGSVVLDLGHGYRHNVTSCWVPGVYFNVFDVVENGDPDNGTWYTAEQFSTPEHCGTHMDAPYHFYKQGWKLGDIPLERFVVEGVHVNVTHQVNGNPDFMLNVDHLRKWEQVNGAFPNKSVVLINFGWSDKFGDRLEYYKSSTSSDRRFPGLSAEAAQWIVDSGKFVGLGVDGPSTDAGISSTYPVHKILSKANMYSLENVALNGTSLPARGFKLVVQPIKILDGTGGPCRILAFTENKFE